MPRGRGFRGDISMISIRKQIISHLIKLPDQCLAMHPTARTAIMITAGVVGFEETRGDVNVRRFNEERGITRPEVNAMIAVSVFGFQCPAANPDSKINTDPQNDPYA